MPIITVSRQLGSYGDEIAEAVSKKLGWELLNRDSILSRFFRRYRAAAPAEAAQGKREILSDPMQLKYVSYSDYLKQELFAMSLRQSAVLVGFGSQVIFSEYADSLHIRIIASADVRVSRLKKQYHITGPQARSILMTSDRKHKRFVKTLFGIDLDDTALYDLILNTDRLSVYESVAAVIQLIREKEQARELSKQTEKTGAIDNASEYPLLKNPSETEFARILDMYQIDWKYEPKTFPIEWDAEGNVTLAFSPDFYLPRFDTYIELTTMDQRYISQKNKKMKRLQEMYPGINISIVNKKGFLALLDRFNPVT